MNWNNVRLILLREIRDQLRDRRTIFMVVVLPLILYPALGIGMVQMMVLFTEQPRTVVVLGAENLPDPPLIEGDQFRPEWFELPGDADRLRVVTASTMADAEAGAQKQQAELLASAESVRDAHTKVAALQDDLTAALQAEDEAKITQLKSRLDAAREQRRKQFGEGLAEVVILVPEGFAESVARANTRISERDREGGDVAISRPVVLHNKAKEKSLLAYTWVKEALGQWESALLNKRLELAQLPQSLPNPVNPESVDLAIAKDRAASVWSKLFPALLILMTVTGAFYPAIDLGAGEKERGTMETLLICPASRAEIVLGKFFTVLAFSIGTAVLNLASMGFTGNHMASMAGGAASASKLGALAAPPLASLIWVAVLMVPIAALFSSLCLSLATFAKSSKEGQYYLTPLLVVTIGLTVFCLSPAVELTPLYSILPVIGPALLLKELLSAGGAGDQLWYAPAVLATSIGYGLLALWWAIDQFNREEVLFREAERFDLSLWLRHLMRDKEDTPSFAEAGVCFVLILLLQFIALPFLRGALPPPESEAFGVAMVRLLLVQQIAIIATPALLMGVMLTRSFRQTFSLYWPSWKYLAGAVLLSIFAHPLATTLLQQLDWFFPTLPPSVMRQFAAMSDANVPFWLAILGFAVAPALCEEITFRGFMLSGFRNRGRVWLAITLSALTFGLIHMIPQQVFNASLLGLLLGWIAIRSKSLLPGILFHFIWNGTEVMLMRVDEKYFQDTSLKWLASAGEQGLVFHWPILLVCGLVTVGTIRWLMHDASPSEDSNRLDEDPSLPVSSDLPQQPVSVG
ncbi:ABC transporter permease subunit/CPBP intramembrane protease [Stratiformator vulcanicus]|uniref:ABC-2 family transporter protein n=1 Tax=Stratiformator vulcanicus TaxID=2527980 RepID=A0A517R6R9_9PLAN|nr:ABC transporter permease subunit/CPBP intramembrane protease [Stratiformator vulcanicus]QDT39555.1 ABC-2 family transporter protein [Stratiformator vulcanicus]